MNGISVSTSEMETGWLRSLVPDMNLNYSAISVGFIPKRFPLQAVISQHKTNLDLGEQERRDEWGNILGVFHSYMKAKSLSIAAEVDGRHWKVPLLLSVGYSRKEVTQDLGMTTYIDSLTEVPGRSEDEVYDYGLLLSVPLNNNLSTPNDDNLSLAVTPSFGYSVSNIGGYVTFPGSTAEDPTPRYLRLGFSISINISYKSEWTLAEWRGGRAASDMLIDTSDPEAEPYPYQTGLGDIDFIKHVVRNQEEEGIEVYRGDEITLLDFYTFRRGRRIDKLGRIDIGTMGYGYNLNGVLHLLHFVTKKPIFNTIAKHLNVQYNYSNYYSWPYENWGSITPVHSTEFESFIFTVNNIDQLIRAILKK